MPLISKFEAPQSIRDFTRLLQLIITDALGDQVDVIEDEGELQLTFVDPQGDMPVDLTVAILDNERWLHLHRDDDGPRPPGATLRAAGGSAVASGLANRPQFSFELDQSVGLMSVGSK